MMNRLKFAPAMAWLLHENGVRGDAPGVDTTRYFDELLHACISNAVALDTRWPYYRARIMDVGHYDWDGPHPPEQMGPPPFALARCGRLNRQGTSYLYLASSPETAIAEVRPWRESWRR